MKGLGDRQELKFNTVVLPAGNIPHLHPIVFLFNLCFLSRSSYFLIGHNATSLVIGFSNFWPEG